MTKTFKIQYRYLGGQTMVVGVVDEARLNEILGEGKHTMVECVEYTPTVTYRTCAGCARCTTDEVVPHYNCIYQGRAMGHSDAHCTADSCF